ncbi:hypothetical protein KRX57_01505 [Weeksellaceae bacterium TAE3-ERU29]|nr:hypothetical protein [Weeksellaceae bacterium TAE3-ERU29]
MNNISIIFISILIFVSCNEKKQKETILLADREAPLGWVYLRVYKDKTFEFESRGLERKGTVYSGIVELKNDTLYFKYSGSIPKAGNKAILTKQFVSYFNGDYPERLEVKQNELKSD